MRSEVPCGMYMVPSPSVCSSCWRPATKLEHTAGEAPNRYSSRKAWRRKLRISAKYCSLDTLGQRPVVVDAGDGLHAPAVAVRQAHAVHALGAAHVRRAVAADRDGLVGRQAARHAGDPQHLVAQRAVGELVDLQSALPGRSRALACTPVISSSCDFAVVGGDVRMRQRRAQRLRMRRQGQRAVRRGAQAFLFDAAADALQPIAAEGWQGAPAGCSCQRKPVVSCGVGRKVARLAISCFDAGQRQIW